MSCAREAALPVHTFTNLPWHVMVSVSVCVSSTAVGTDACSSDEDCELNGACLDKKCKCRPGWVGPSCGTLDVLPAPTAGAWPLHRYSEPTISDRWKPSSN